VLGLPGLQVGDVEEVVGVLARLRRLVDDGGGTDEVFRVDWETSSLSLPVTQWFGASRWVPVCSPVRMLFQYQAGPRSS